jgi:hypothetical protein
MTMPTKSLAADRAELARRIAKHPAPPRAAINPDAARDLLMREALRVALIRLGVSDGKS